jgi:hypothetical protein
MKTITNIIYPAFAVFALACFALSPAVQAVSPPPDGGYGTNTAEGTSALFSLTTGVNNTADGFNALFHNTIGASNTANGWQALFNNTTGFNNTANGFAALDHNTTGAYNMANGYQTLVNNTTGTYNTANGTRALISNTIGIQNTANGALALYHNTTGKNNTANGIKALYNNTTGDGNVALGNQAGSNVTTASGTICIGTHVAGANVAASCFIGNIWDVNEGGTGIFAVYINSNGQLGTQAPPSARRFKKEIKPMDKTSEAILALKPITFQYKSDAKGTAQFGLIAEDVEKVNPDLVTRDTEGKVYTVRYEAVNAMLLNEFLKAHRKIEEQGAMMAQERKDFETAIARQREEIQALSARLKEQDSKIEKVSAQLEVSKPAPQTVLNKP